MIRMVQMSPIVDYRSDYFSPRLQMAVVGAKAALPEVNEFGFLAPAPTPMPSPRCERSPVNNILRHPLGMRINAIIPTPRYNLSSVHSVRRKGGVSLASRHPIYTKQISPPLFNRRPAEREDGRETSDFFWGQRRRRVLVVRDVPKPVRKDRSIDDSTFQNKRDGNISMSTTKKLSLSQITKPRCSSRAGKLGAGSSSNCKMKRKASRVVGAALGSDEGGETGVKVGNIKEDNYEDDDTVNSDYEYALNSDEHDNGDDEEGDETLKDEYDDALKSEEDDDIETSRYSVIQNNEHDNATKIVRSEHETALNSEKSKQVTGKKTALALAKIKSRVDSGTRIRVRHRKQRQSSPFKEPSLKAQLRRLHFKSATGPMVLPAASDTGSDKPASITNFIFKPLHDEPSSNVTVQLPAIPHACLAKSPKTRKNKRRHARSGSKNESGIDKNVDGNQTITVTKSIKSKVGKDKSTNRSTTNKVEVDILGKNDIKSAKKTKLRDACVQVDMDKVYTNRDMICQIDCKVLNFIKVSKQKPFKSAKRFRTAVSRSKLSETKKLSEGYRIAMQKCSDYITDQSPSSPALDEETSVGSSPFDSEQNDIFPELKHNHCPASQKSLEDALLEDIKDRVFRSRGKKTITPSLVSCVSHNDPQVTNCVFQRLSSIDQPQIKVAHGESAATFASNKSNLKETTTKLKIKKKRKEKKKCHSIDSNLNFNDEERGVQTFLPKVNKAKQKKKKEKAEDWDSNLRKFMKECRRMAESKHNVAKRESNNTKPPKNLR